MALLQWRKFVFFDDEFIVDTEVNQLLSHEGPQDLVERGKKFVTVDISCSASGRGNVLLGDTNGYVYIINKQLKINSFHANQKHTSHIKQVPKSPLFITCGSDQAGVNPLIKIWDPEKTDRLNQPICVRVIRANSGFTKPSQITCIDCNDTLTLMAVGFDDGSLVLYHGDITRQRRSRFTRPIKISERPLSGIQIRGESKRGQNQSEDPTAFIATDEEIFFANLSEKSFSKVQLDSAGCKPKLCCLLSDKSSTDHLFAVGRRDAVYFYQVEGKGPCLAFDGDKIMLHRFKSYLVIASREPPPKTDPISLRNRRSQADLKPLDELSTSRRVSLNIYDIRHKFIAHSSLVPEIQDIISEWSQLFVICKSGQVIILREKDTQSKLDILFRKDQFSLLIDIARSHHYNEDALTDIFRHYGDHLFRKSDFDGAIQQYIKTIGHSEPSYVIRKFLDSKKISNLTVYLEALHKKDCAMPDHTKLLLNCYSEFGSNEQLENFIASYEDGNIKFDVEIAIKVLRDAGFHDFAIDLAKKRKKHDPLFKLLMDAKNDCEASLEYMEQMTDPNEMAIYMKMYGRRMLKSAPEKTIGMIKTICRRSCDMLNQIPQNGDSNQRFLEAMFAQIYPEEFFHIFVDDDDLYVQLLEQLMEDDTCLTKKSVHNLLLELYLNAWRKEKDDLIKGLRAEKIMKLLSHPSDQFNVDQALILCRNNRFDEGLIDLYARKKLYHLVLQYYIDQDDSLKIMKTCESYGQESPNLYMPALIHYSRGGDERLSQLLKSIEHHKVIAPMVVLKILLESRKAKLGSIKEYLIRYLGKLHDKHIDNENAIDHYKDDTEIVRNRIEEFETHQTVFKPSKCSACQGILDLPSVHFLCSHSYHQNCFYNYSAENDECPICVTNNRKLLDEIGSHETSKSTLNKLEREFTNPSDDAFNSVAKLFGYGLFN